MQQLNGVEKISVAISLMLNHNLTGLFGVAVLVKPLFLAFRLADVLECSFTHFIFKPAVDTDVKEPQAGKPSNTGLFADSNTGSNVYCLSTVE